MKEKKKLSIIILIAIVIVLVVIILISKGNKNTNTTIENNMATSEVEVEDVTFSDITKIYENGITTITANMKNDTKKTTNFTIEIIMKDETGKEVQNMIQVIENLEPGKTKKLSTGIVGDYAYIKDIQFKVIN